MRGTKVTQILIDGIAPIDVHVDGSGMFLAEFNDNEYEAASRKELDAKLQKAVKQFRETGVVDVTVIGRAVMKRSKSVDRESGEAVHAKLRSKHERQYNTWLLVTEDGIKFQVSGSYDGTIVRRLTDDEVARYRALIATKTAAERAVQAFVDDVKIEPDTALREAGRTKS
jgi:hypothetical protein